MCGESKNENKLKMFGRMQMVTVKQTILEST